MLVLYGSALARTQRPLSRRAYTVIVSTGLSDEARVVVPSGQNRVTIRKAVSTVALTGVTLSTSGTAWSGR